MKSRIVILCGLLLMMSSILFAQTAPDTLWTRIFGGGNYEWGRCVKQTNDGGYIIVGDTYSYGAGHFDVWLIKTNNNGDTLWTKTFGGIGEDRGFSVQQTSDGGYIITGATSSYGAGGFNIWLIKTDNNGNSSWTKTFGGNGWEWGYSVQQTTDNGYIIVGVTDPTGMGVFDICLIKTDSSGNSSWTKTFGGNSSDLGYSVQQTTDGGYIIVGDTYSYGAGSRDVYLIKTNTNGDSLWTKTFGGSGSDGGNSVYQSYDNGYIITGFTKSFGAGDKDVWLIKTNNNGDTLWTKTFGGSSEDCGYSVQQTIDTNYIIAGYTKSYGAGNYDVWLIETNNNGDTLWTKTIGGSNFDQGRFVRQTTDGGYIVVGDTYDYYAGEYNIYLIRIGSVTGIKSQTNLIPKFFNLYNYPNPFNSTTTIRFTISPKGQADVRFTILKVYDVLGNEFATLVNEKLQAGSYEVDWPAPTGNASGYSSGVYFYRLISEDFIDTKRMVLIK